MSTDKQVAANRENALKSHGPITEAGKAAVRLNALKHGLRARQLVLPGESQEEFDQLCQGLETEWQPQTPTEQACLEQIGIHLWKLARAQKHEAWAQGLPFDDPARAQQLKFAFDYQLRWERAFQRTLRELHNIRKNRRMAAEKEAEIAAEAAAPPPDPHPPVRPWFVTCKHPDGTLEKVVSVAAELWNSHTQQYERVWDPRLKYMRSALPTIIPDLVPPAAEAPPEINAPASEPRP